MASLSTKNKEEIIVSTIISCNNEIKKFIKFQRLNESIDKFNLYSYNMVQLLGEINPMFENNNYLDNISINESLNYVKNNHNNYKAYFSNVLNFLNSFELNVQTTLNESLNVDISLVEKPMQVNINTFKEDLKQLIEFLSKQNDLNYLNTDSLKIKILTKKPILINGFDICNNKQLQNVLFENFKITNNNINSIIFDKSNKQLLFLNNDNFDKTICYDLKSDSLDYYNKMNYDNNEVNILPNKKINDNSVLEDLKQILEINNLIEIYHNVDKMKFEFTDNLYQDTKRNQYNQNIEKSRKSLIK